MQTLLSHAWVATQHLSCLQVQEVMRAGLRLLFNGDASQWDRAMQLPHYNTRSMPAVSLHTGLHLIQVCCVSRLSSAAGPKAAPSQGGAAVKPAGKLQGVSAAWLSSLAACKACSGQVPDDTLVYSSRLDSAAV